MGRKSDKDKNKPDTSITYPSGNELTAWRLAAKAQQPMQLSLPPHQHATQEELHKSKSSEHYSVTTHSFHKRHKSTHHPQNDLSEHHSMHGTSVFKAFEKSTEAQIDDEQKPNTCCCPFW